MDIRAGESPALAANRVQCDLDEGHYDIDDVAPLERRRHNTHRVRMRHRDAHATCPIPVGALLTVRRRRGRRGWRRRGHRGYRPFFPRRRYHRRVHPLWYLPLLPLALLGRRPHNVERVALRDPRTGETRELLIAARHIAAGEALRLAGKSKRRGEDDGDRDRADKRLKKSTDDEESSFDYDDMIVPDDAPIESDALDPATYVPALLSMAPAELDVDNSNFRQLFNVPDSKEDAPLINVQLIMESVRAAADLGLSTEAGFVPLDQEPTTLVLEHDPLIGSVYGQLYLPAVQHEGVLLPDHQEYAHAYSQFLTNLAIAQIPGRYLPFLEPESFHQKRVSLGLEVQRPGLPPRVSEAYRELHRAPALVTEMVHDHVAALRRDDEFWNALFVQVDGTSASVDLPAWISIIEQHRDQVNTASVKIEVDEDAELLATEDNADESAKERSAREVEELEERAKNKPRDTEPALMDQVVFAVAFDELVDGPTDNQGNRIAAGRRADLASNATKLARRALQNVDDLATLVALYMYVCPPADFSEDVPYELSRFSFREGNNGPFGKHVFYYRGANAIAEVMADAMRSEWAVHAEENPHGLLADTVRQLSVIRWAQHVLRARFANLPAGGEAASNRDLYMYNLRVATRAVLDELAQRVLMLYLSPELDLTAVDGIYGEGSDDVTVIRLEVPGVRDPEQTQLTVSLSDDLARQLVTKRPLRRVQVSVGMLEATRTIEPILTELRRSGQVQTLNLYVEYGQLNAETTGITILGGPQDPAVWSALTTITVGPRPEANVSYYDLYLAFDREREEEEKQQQQQKQGEDEKEKAEANASDGPLMSDDSEISVSADSAPFQRLEEEEEEMIITSNDDASLDSMILSARPGQGGGDGYDMRWFENAAAGLTHERFPALTTLAVLPQNDPGDAAMARVRFPEGSDLLKHLTRAIFPSDAMADVRHGSFSKKKVKIFAVPASGDFLDAQFGGSLKQFHKNRFSNLTVLLLPDAYLSIGMTTGAAKEWWKDKRKLAPLWTSRTSDDEFPAVIMHHAACYQLSKSKALEKLRVLSAHYSPFLFKKAMPDLEAYLLPSAAVPSAGTTTDSTMKTAFRHLVRPVLGKNASEDNAIREPMDYLAACKKLKVLALYSAHYTSTAEEKNAWWGEEGGSPARFHALQTVVLSIESIGDGTTLQQLELRLPALAAGKAYIPISTAIDPVYDVATATSKATFIKWLNGEADMPLRSFMHYCRVDEARVISAFGKTAARKFWLTPNPKSNAKRDIHLLHPTSQMLAELADAGLYAPRMREWLENTMDVPAGAVWPAFGAQLAFQWTDQETLGAYRRVFGGLHPRSTKTRTRNMQLVSVPLGDTWESARATTSRVSGGNDAMDIDTPDDDDDDDDKKEADVTVLIPRKKEEGVTILIPRKKEEMTSPSITLPSAVPPPAKRQIAHAASPTKKRITPTPILSPSLAPSPKPKKRMSFERIGDAGQPAVATTLADQVQTAVRLAREIYGAFGGAPMVIPGTSDTTTLLYLIRVLEQVLGEPEGEVTIFQSGVRLIALVATLIEKFAEIGVQLSQRDEPQLKLPKVVLPWAIGRLTEIKEKIQ